MHSDEFQNARVGVFKFQISHDPGHHEWRSLTRRTSFNHQTNQNPIMKKQLKLAALVLLATFNFQLATVFAQGSLTPPGAPAATMKSLDQIEPRTPISSAPFTITNPGSYYLAANLTVSSG